MTQRNRVQILRLPAGPQQLFLLLDTPPETELSAFS
jgi:hypothetical protein